jgi:hypothetical protein
MNVQVGQIDREHGGSHPFMKNAPRLAAYNADRGAVVPLRAITRPSVLGKRARPPTISR